MDDADQGGGNRASGRGAAFSPDFEFLPPSGQGAPHHLPITIKSLSAGGVILEVRYPREGLDLKELQGQSSTIRLPATGNGREVSIRGKVLWTRLPAGEKSNFLLGLELEEPTLEARQALEDQLPIATKDIKELWDQWDRFQEKPAAAASPSLGIYLVGLGVVVGGLGLQLLGPEDFKSFGFILVLYGCFTLIIKSLWSLWRQKANAKDQERPALNR